MLQGYLTYIAGTLMILVGGGGLLLNLAGFEAMESARAMELIGLGLGAVGYRRAKEKQTDAIKDLLEHLKRRPA